MIDKKKLIEELLDCVADATDTETQITSLTMAGLLMNEVLDEALTITQTVVQDKASLNIKSCDDFEQQLKEYRINYKRYSTYHFQIQRQHNFYPTKKSYYNSESDEKFTHPTFKNNNELLAFLSENVA